DGPRRRSRSRTTRRVRRWPNTSPGSAADRPRILSHAASPSRLLPGQGVEQYRRATMLRARAVTRAARLACVAGFAVAFTAPVWAQTIEDGVMMSKGQLFTGAVY